jgi:hypothetical protein
LLNFALLTVAVYKPARLAVFNMKANKYLVIIFFLLLPGFLQAQRYDLFEIEHDELYWRNTYQYQGSQDSLRRLVVEMLKSKFFTFNVVRNEVGYNGEIRHYKVQPEKYHRTWFNTPRLYTDGEWTGKFTVEVSDNQYKVMIYALYGDRLENTSDHYKPARIVKGRYIEIVARKDRSGFKKSELANMALMSMSLKDEFDVRNTKLPEAR